MEFIAPVPFELISRVSWTPEPGGVEPSVPITAFTFGVKESPSDEKYAMIFEVRERNDRLEMWQAQFPDKELLEIVWGQVASRSAVRDLVFFAGLGQETIGQGGGDEVEEGPAKG